MDNKKPSLLSQQLDAADAMTNELRPAIIACEKFTMGLNAQPEKSKIKKHQNIDYIPISAIEAELDRMYAGLWQTKNMNVRVVANEILVDLELHVFHPIAKMWLSRTGTGAATIKQVKDSAITDLDSKYKNTLQKDFPAAKALAVKNAAKSLGVKFGRNLGRKDNVSFDYKPMIVMDKNDKQLAEATIKQATDIPKLMRLWAINKKWHQSPVLTEIYQETLTELQNLKQNG